MDYDVIERLARGGMGVVDLARAPDGSLVALKRLSLHGTAAEMQQAAARFDRELDVLRRIDHPAVVPLVDVVDDHGDLVLVMPYLAGGNLAEVVATDGPMSQARVRAMAERLLPALAAAHRLGVVHRDIKPHNILFDDRGRAHLADFGVASTRDDTGGLTRTGVVLGTPGYLAPEQARGEEVTAASDIASLGAALHFAATGQSPYAGGEPQAVLLRTARGKATIDRGIDGELRAVLAAMLDPRPERRPSAAALAGGAAGTDPVPLLARRTRPGLLVGAVVLAAATTVGVAVSLDSGDRTSSTATDAPVEDGEATTTTEPCTPMRFQPCGGAPAPNTDGRDCIDDHADYDGFTSNGCEVAPDGVDGTRLTSTLEATIAPADDADRYPLRVRDEGDFGCNNTLRVQLVAPEGTSLRLELFDEDGDAVGEATSSDGVPGEIAVRDPRCFQNDGGDYAVAVSPIGSDRSPLPYVLTTTGSF